MTRHTEDKVTIRFVRIEDAAAILSLQRDVVCEDEFFIAVPEEFNKTMEQQLAWIQSIIDNDRETILVAEINGELAGMVVFASPARKRLSHTGSITMMIQKAHRNKGIGKVLLKELLAWAEQHPLIEKVSLGVFSNNLRAIALYKSLGFVEEGRKVKEFKLAENEYVDDVLMYKFV
ncbi:GNAT family N-acetyltransferase [Brevibacillus brevis]|uniref:GNAT family N-acetyltransferase n=1 Tax=Brevibacillus brevis TaxID=1393 RepID=UPI000D0F136C|nr:GNAT family N-acetyltransferase [Brevibacillus brevis]PSJ67944.1 GNAT family N-acetyltransferase [Brevibacillus brevis]GEC87928.1 N-acetyltransferase [Brevibacillus brevis]